MKKMFDNRREIKDFREDQNNSHSYKWKPINSEKYDIWLKYYKGDKIDNETFSVKELLGGNLQHAYVYFKKHDSEQYYSYEYDGDVIVKRLTRNNVRTDLILNIENIEKDVKKQIEEIERCPK